MKREDNLEKQGTTKSENVEGLDELKRGRYEVRLFVATLIATVSFAAAFTIPGGYKTDQGTATSIHKAAFKAFVIFDTAAFCFSAATVYLLFYATPRLYHGSPGTPANYFPMPLSYIFGAMVSMALAFATGLHVMLANSLELVIAVYAMVGSFLLYFSVHWFCDPCGYPLWGDEYSGPRMYIINKLVDYGVI